MLITPVDDKNNLFLVENIYPSSVIDSIQQEKIFDYEHTPVEWQEYKPRRKLVYDDISPFAKIDKFLSDNFGVISKAIGKKVVHSTTHIWLDEPGFNMGIHLDNPGVNIAMQLYLNKGPMNMGTKFYHKNSPDSLRYDFPYRLNSGYIMINNDENQWHGFPSIVPNHTYRLSSYTYFYIE